MRFSIATVMLPMILGVICLGQADQAVTPVPSIKQWNSRGKPLSIEPVPPLVPLWSTDIKVAKHETTPALFIFTMGAVLTGKIAVILSCLNTTEHEVCGTAQLVTFDAKTGKPLASLEWSRKQYPRQLGLFSNTMDTFLVQDNEAVTEYDEVLKPRNQVKLPRGFGLSGAPAYGYGDWAETTKTTCKGAGVSVYELNEYRKLILGCGNEVGVLNENWQLLFAEFYVAPVHVEFPVFSLDGNRFILMTTKDHVEPPSHLVTSYMLYDVHADAQTPRQIVFSTSAGTLVNQPAWISLSPDGTMFAVVEKGRLSMYRLPR